ncbi:hypothetical protein ORI98_14065 [Shewanella sp. ULN5]|uniref:hypothetical protein n=1 Tax=Shewanella sp. ULN5 TaxID=2994678 RepID=UPI00273E14B5|nr:hypothetical protein [Shewanella sp. ULN5]MDP5147564.1 hypothetical protein [Shewanella sp. ULN5]
MSKYLIVEDNLEKFGIVKDELLGLKISEKDIEHVISVNEATNLMKVKVYSMVILDLNLPMTKNGRALENGGISLLKKIQSSPKKYNLPKQIIGLTSYENLKKEQRSNFENLSFSLYDFELSDWKVVLANKIAWDQSSNTSKIRVAGKKVILSVHGIRTLGHWQNKLESAISKHEDDFVVENFKYNYFSAIQLLLPKYREIVIRKLTAELERLSEQYPDAQLTVFAHSFGTYAVVKALESLPISCDLNIKKLFLVSSVMKSDYCFNNLSRRYFIKNIFNECGYNDNVLILSHYACVDMGMAGRSGFEGSQVINRFYKGGHDFFNRENCFIEKFWVPTICGNDATQVDERKFSSLRENVEILLYTRHIPFGLFFTILVVIAATLFLDK